MSVHDWRRVDAGTFHAFHTAWITHLSESLNGGVLPEGFYALAEQHAGRVIADVLTLQLPIQQVEKSDGGVAVLERPPKVRQKLSSAPSARTARRTLTIRHISSHRVIAMIEIVSPANKDRVAHVEDFVDKAENALLHGVHLLLVDLFPPTPADPYGMHGAVWQRFDNDPEIVPADAPLSMASYVAAIAPDAYVQRLTWGAELISMPLFLNADRYVDVPLESEYMKAYQGMPVFVRQQLQ